MTVHLTPEGVIALRGECPSEDAEILLQHLTGGSGPVVDWRECDRAHSAVVQLLMASGVELVGPPRGAFLRDMVEPAIKAR
jgi:hypothetical protein